MRTDMRGPRLPLALLVAPGLAAGLRFSRLDAWQAREPRAAMGASDDAAVDELIGRQCTKCHVRPPPEYVPRGLWRFRVQEMEAE